jgi:hypothetical protein
MSHWTLDFSTDTERVDSMTHRGEFRKTRTVVAGVRCKASMLLKSRRERRNREDMWSTNETFLVAATEVLILVQAFAPDRCVNWRVLFEMLNRLRTCSLPIKFTLDVPSSEPSACGRDMMVNRELYNFVAVGCVFKLACVEIDVDESCSICTAANFKQAVLGFIEAFNAIELGCLALLVSIYFPSH